MLRIFPLYFAFLSFLCFTTLLLHSQSAARVKFLRAVPYYATYTSNWMPSEMREPIFGRSWSLSVEEQFYLVWPTILVLCGIRNFVPILLAFIGFTVVGQYGNFGSGGLYLANHLVPFSAIAAGVLLAITLDRRRGFHALNRVLGQRNSVLVALGLLVLLLSIPGQINGLTCLAVHVSMAAIVCSVVVREDHALSWLTNARLLVHIGVVSYGIYVLHSQFGGLTDRGARLIASVLNQPSLARNRVLLFVVLTTTSTLAATFSYYFFESYFLKLKDRFAARKQSATSA